MLIDDTASARFRIKPVVEHSYALLLPSCPVFSTGKAIIIIIIMEKQKEGCTHLHSLSSSAPN
jgi:hypothetical protein